MINENVRTRWNVFDQNAFVVTRIRSLLVQERAIASRWFVSFLLSFHAKPTTGIDDIHPKSIFFKVFPCKNRRIRDSARWRAWNGACVRRSHPAPRARAVSQNRDDGGVTQQNTPRIGSRPLQIEPQPGDFLIFIKSSSSFFFSHGGSYFS
jgi:hypothetical protein